MHQRDKGEEKVEEDIEEETNGVSDFLGLHASVYTCLVSVLLPIRNLSSTRLTQTHQNQEQRTIRQSE